jgi:hypothetical protein
MRELENLAATRVAMKVLNVSRCGSVKIPGTVHRQAALWAVICPTGEVIDHTERLALHWLRRESHEQKHNDHEHRSVRSQPRAEKHIWKSPFVVHFLLLFC